MMRALTFSLGALADARFGDPPTRWHPVGLIGRTAGVLRAYAPDEERARRRYGIAAALAMPIAAAVAASAVRRTAARKQALFGLAAEAALLSLACSSKTLLLRASEVEAALAAGDLDAARELLGRHLVSRDTSALDASEVAAATIESVAENLSDGVIAPWIAYALGGLPLAVAYRAANTLDALWGYRTPEFEALGAGAARLDDLLNLLPARVTALAIIAAARGENLDGSGNSMRALRVWRRDAALTESPNAGHPMAAMAGALGVRLEKRNAYILGAELPAASATDISAAIALARHAMIFTGSAIFALLLVNRGLK